MMKNSGKIRSILCAVSVAGALFFCGIALPVPMPAVPVHAVETAAGTETDRYVQVNSKDGFLNFRSGPGIEYGTIGDYRFLNGQTIHIVREATASDGSLWGMTNEGGANGATTGWLYLRPTVPVNGQATATAAPAATASSAAPAAAAQTPAATAAAPTSVSTDYYVKVNSNDGFLNFRNGPGVEYASLGGYRFLNGQTVHIVREATASDGSRWGMTNSGGADGATTGWIYLRPTVRVTASGASAGSTAGSTAVAGSASGAGASKDTLSEAEKKAMADEKAAAEKSAAMKAEAEAAGTKEAEEAAETAASAESSEDVKETEAAEPVEIEETEEAADTTKASENAEAAETAEPAETAEAAEVAEPAQEGQGGIPVVPIAVGGVAVLGAAIGVAARRAAVIKSRERRREQYRKTHRRQDGDKGTRA